jgi:hypothetical protein
MSPIGRVVVRVLLDVLQLLQERAVLLVGITFRVDLAPHSLIEGEVEIQLRKKELGFQCDLHMKKRLTKTRNTSRKDRKGMTKTSEITYHLSKLLGQLVETVQGLRWCSFPPSERNIACRFSWPCCKTHDEMEEGVGDSE